MQLSIDRYHVRRLIGQGAMGKIYLATDPKLGRDVAIKLLTSSTDREVRERFRLEARAIAALKHPNIVELYDFSGEAAEQLFLVLEYIAGRTLHEHVTERGPMPEVTTLCVAHELALALDHAHRNNVVHRDLKPENVLLSDGRVVLTDFGIVKQIAAEGSRRDDITGAQVLGTPGFMAPEQITGRDVTPRTDLFALGAVLYNLATGRPPFVGASVSEVAELTRRGELQDPRDFSPLLSVGFCRLVTKCLQPRSKDRFASAGAARETVLEALRAHGVVEVRSEIVDYEKNPATHAIAQRERGLDVLVRDLKIAIKDRDEPRLQAIVERMQTIAPLNNHVKDVTGITFDKNQRARLAREEAGGVRRLPWLLLGLLLGGALGGAGALGLLVSGYLPSSVIAWFERAAGWMGIGY